MARKDSKGRRRRQNGYVAFGNALLMVVVLVIVAGGALIYYGAQQFSAPGPTTADSTFLVKEGNAVKSLGGRLSDEGLIRNDGLVPGALIYKGAMQFVSDDAKLLPGQYTIPAGSSMADIIKILTTTKPQVFAVTVPEGETSFQAAARVRLASNSLTGDLAADPAEGTILPGQYAWTDPSHSRQAVLDDMQAAMKAKLAAVWAARDTSFDDVIKTPEDLLTMASLVEKETGLASERTTVASVFINRLRKHMRLQTDPSVLYGITLGKEVLGRGPTSAELRANTPYNTYVIAGLPPGPIANPGEATLEAVAHADHTNFLYFVAKDADPANGHRFSGTYAEHKKNVILYRQAVKAAAAEAESDAAKEALEAEEAQQSGDTTQ